MGRQSFPLLSFQEEDGDLEMLCDGEKIGDDGFFGGTLQGGDDVNNDCPSNLLTLIAAPMVQPCNNDECDENEKENRRPPRQNVSWDHIG